MTEDPRDPVEVVRSEIERVYALGRVFRNAEDAAGDGRGTYLAYVKGFEKGARLAQYAALSALSGKGEPPAVPTDEGAAAGTVRVKVTPDFTGFEEALENGLRDAEESASPLLAILTRIEDHLHVIARAHQPIRVDGHEFRHPKKES